MPMSTREMFARMIKCEAGGEGFNGMKAVASTIMNRVHGTNGFSMKPEIDLSIARPLMSTMHKLHRAGVDNYVTTNGRIRRLAPRECLRLMGFTDDFKQVVSNTQMYRQAGNSVVVDVFMALIKEIIKCI